MCCFYFRAVAGSEDWSIFVWGSSASCSNYHQNFTDTFSVSPPPQRPSWMTSPCAAVASVWHWLWRGRTSTASWRAPPRPGWRWTCTSCRTTPSTPPPTPVSHAGSALSSTLSSATKDKMKPHGYTSKESEMSILLLSAKLQAEAERRVCSSVPRF